MWANHAYPLTYYRGMLKNHRPSPERVAHMEALVKQLQAHGRVVLCRLPVDPRMAALEDTYWPYFNATIEAVAARTSTAYINLRPTSGRYRTTDANHVYKEDAVRLTKQLAKRVFD